MNILEISDLRKKFGNKEVLKGVNLTVPKHSIFGFIGQNGAGKTTTMKSVLGLLEPDEGEIMVAGDKVNYGQTNTNKFIGYLPDVPEFYNYMTPMEYLIFCGEITGMESNDIKKRSAELLELVGLGSEKHRIKGFSRGMKQRLGIAQALLSRPQLLICDEPTSALDPVGRKEILDILVSAKEQTTVLFSTHILSDVEKICTDVALLHNGKTAMQGSLSKIKEIHLSDDFEIIVENKDDADKLNEIFVQCRLLDTNRLLLKNSEEKLSEVLSYIAQNNISINKIERQEATLESLFLEVVEK